MPRENLKDKATELSRLNTLIRSETMKNIKIVGAETSRTISAAADYLLRLGIKAYVAENGDAK
jgi:hypothetical protein